MEKNNREMERYFCANFHLTLVLALALLTPKELENEKIEKISIEEGIKLKIVKVCLSRTLFVSTFSFFKNAVTLPFITFVTNSPFG